MSYEIKLNIVAKLALLYWKGEWEIFILKQLFGAKKQKFWGVGIYVLWDFFAQWNYPRECVKECLTKFEERR